MADTMTDHIAKTQATLMRCIAAGQWQNVAAIGGFRSVHDARIKHDTAYSAQFMREEVAREIEDDRRPLTPSRLHNVPPRNRRTDESKWQEATRIRIMALNISSRSLSEMMGFDQTYISSLMVHGARRSQHVYDRINSFLGTLEKNIKPVPIKCATNGRSGASSPEWRKMVLDRLSALGMARDGFAKYLRMSRSTFRACMADSGYLSATCRFRIEDGLACLESGPAALRTHVEAA